MRIGHLLPTSPLCFRLVRYRNLGKKSSDDWTPTVAISFAIDETAKEQAERLGAVKFIDKMELANELVPTLLQFAPPNKPS